MFAPQVFPSYEAWGTRQDGASIGDLEWPAASDLIVAESFSRRMEVLSRLMPNRPEVHSIDHAILWHRGLGEKDQCSKQIHGGAQGIRLRPCRDGHLANRQ